MHYYGAAIEQYPITVAIPFDARDVKAGAFEGIPNVVRDRSCLNFRSSRDDNERIRDNALSRDVDLDEIFSFFIEGCFANGLK